MNTPAVGTPVIYTSPLNGRDFACVVDDIARGCYGHVTTGPVYQLVVREPGQGLPPGTYLEASLADLRERSTSCHG